VKLFEGLDNINCRCGGLYYSNDKDQQNGATECSNAKAMSHEDRLAMVLAMPSDDEEEEEMEVEKMEFDNDIFDAEGDSDADNHQQSPKKVRTF
jgi:hypothetical protein